MAEREEKENEIDAKEDVVFEAEIIEEEEEAPVPEELAEEEGEDVSQVERLQQELEEARAEAEEYLDGWRRAQAEFSNYKKRQRAEQAKIRELANANLLRKLLPVLDDFDRAMTTLPAGLRHLTWIQGLLMIERKLQAVLETEGVEPIETEGESFDPNYHEAVTHEEVEGFEEGRVIGEVQKGYVLGDRVLRPALVRVAKALPAKAEPEDDVSDPSEAESQAEASPQGEA